MLLYKSKDWRIIMYKLTAPIINENNEKLPIIKKLLKEIIGYNDDEIQQFISQCFLCDIVRNITIVQAKLIKQPFKDYGITNMPLLQKEGSNIVLSFTKEGVILEQQPPKDHYYDEPVISRDHLVNPFTQKEIERQENLAKRRAEEVVQRNTTPTITCPYCKSTDCKKISGLSKAGSVALWGIFALGKTTKQFHCNNCKADF